MRLSRAGHANREVFPLQAPRGLYDPSYEHDACGVAFVARVRAPASHEVVKRALHALERLEHRGAEGADPDTGDGAGILIQLPDAFLRAEASFDLPEAGHYGVAVCFLPTGNPAEAMRLLEERVEAEGQTVLGWREVPVNEAACGSASRAVAPRIAQLFVGAGDDIADQDAFERKLYVIRRGVERADLDDLAIPSFSSRTMVLKGMLTAPQLPRYFPDLRDERVVSRLALVHSRFSTNTFPSWELAHPYRMLAHNGEINTLRGNRNWMRARELQLASPLFGDDIEKVRPLLRDDISDSASLDGLMELLVLGGRSAAHATSMLIPEAHQGRPDLPGEVRDFYAYHSSLVEPWDGPAAVAFSDGRVIGATLDRNGLRPGRWLVTKDGWVVFASEAGVIEVPADQVASKGRLLPGKLFLVDLERDAIVPDTEIKQELGARRPYGKWLADRVVHIEDLPEKTPRVPRVEPLRAKQLAFGWTEEDLRVTLVPMARDGAEPTGSMGNDTALAVLSDMRPPLFSYFKQLFAQVTNPAIDPIRESIVMSLEAVIGPEINLLDETPDHCHQLVMPQPLLRSTELEKLRQVDHSVFEARTIDMTWPADEGAQGMERRLEEMCAEASELVERGVNILILSDRNLGAERVAMPALLATAAVHHHLVREGTRLQSGLIVETGQAKEIHHVACLIGYGASAVNPYVMFESLYALHREGRLPEGMAPDEAVARDDQGDRQGPPEDPLEDGDLDDPLLHGRADLRGDRAREGARGPPLHGHAVARRRRWAERARLGVPRPPRTRLPRGELRAAACGRHLRLAPRRRVPRLEPGDDRDAPAGRPRGGRRGRLRALRHLRERGGGAEVGAARAAPLQGGGRARAARRGRARGRDREALQVGRHVARRAVARGARDARHRHEPARRKVEHRRGRRGPGPLRRRPPLVDQAGGLRPLRRDRATTS